jgi:bacteriophage N4 adsorption protein B
LDSLYDISFTEIVFAFLALGNILSGLDDLFVDVYYWVSYLVRRITYPRRKYPLLSDEDLDALPQKRGAILVAAWHEEDVIEEMLVTNSKLIDYQNYDFFIACYPNDLPTQARIDAAAARLPNVHKAVNPQPGPSNKADNLNAAFAALRRQERISGRPYDFIVMHDPEDVLHPLELKLYNYLMTKRRVNMIQTPVFPIETPVKQFTAGSYMDEFAETHTKDIYVREWARGFVPSAGVGTCIARSVFDKLSEEYGDKVFNTNSLTEDYDFGLRLKMSGHKAIFVRQALVRKKSAGGAGKEKAELIATRAHFPATFKTAVRQRTRWMVGIIFQNWKHFGWTGTARTRWMLFHDRKGVWANLLVLLNYVFMAFGLVHLLLRKTIWPELAPLMHEHAWINLAVSLCMTMMLNRILQRFIATARIYNFKQGLLSIPRLVWGNIINVTVTFRAARQFLTAEMQGKKIAWDKTQHFFPSHGEVVANQHGVAEAMAAAGRTAVARIQEVLTPKPGADGRLQETLGELRQMIEADIARERAARAAAFAERVHRDLAALRTDVARTANRREHTPAQPVMVEPHLEVEEMIVSGRQPSLSDLLLGRRRVSRQPLSFLVDRNLGYRFSD